MACVILQLCSSQSVRAQCHEIPFCSKVCEYYAHGLVHSVTTWSRKQELPQQKEHSHIFNKIGSPSSPQHRLHKIEAEWASCPNPRLSWSLYHLLLSKPHPPNLPDFALDAPPTKSHSEAICVGRLKTSGDLQIFLQISFGKNRKAVRSCQCRLRLAAESQEGLGMTRHLTPKAPTRNFPSDGTGCCRDKNKVSTWRRKWP